MPEKRAAGNSVFFHAHAVIMAGGSGTRFWPLSRRRRPKQLLDLFGQGSLLEQTVARVRRFIPPNRIFIFTNEAIHEQVVRRARGIPPSQIVAEPAQRNTAPTIGLAAHEVLRRDPDGIMIVLPSDQVIEKTGEFLKTIRAACRWASAEGHSVVLGINPSRPETGFGYVRLGQTVARVAGRKVFHVERFTEKPDAALARRYVASRRYLWNAGMFIWRASTLLENLERFQPAMAKGLAGIAASGGVRNRGALKRLFPRLEKVSIDYALMEKIPQVYALAADIGWNDVGSWAMVYDLNRKDADGNVRPLESAAPGSRGSMIVSSGKFVVAVGVRDLVVVETEDALLVCARDRSQEVGRAVQELERRGFKELL